MVRERPRLGTPIGVDGPWLKAILDVLADLHDLLESRLPQPNKGGGEPAPVAEPAPHHKPGKAVPIREPAPVAPPKRDDDEDDEGGPVEVTEPAPAPSPDPEPLPPPPPRAGRGASEPAWRTYAELVGVTVPDGAGRDDIIAACEAAGVIERKEQ
jgi:hypothetical protein